MKKKKKTATARAWRLTKKILLILFIAHLVYLVALKWIDPPMTVTQLTSLVTGEGLQRDYISWKEIPINAKLAVIASEDQLFADHRGFDWKSIEKAMAYNKKKPNRIRGASTISQQVAKNVFLWQGRSWIRKGMEMYFTFMIELLWGKKRILEMYLNVAEMGKGVFGIEAAAQNNFKKAAIKLSRQESAMIAASLPNPKRYTVKPVSIYVLAKYPWIIRQMNNLARDPDIQKIIY
jgi:monofunctional biosynthetic peptidoglycan transglycosylase